MSVRILVADVVDGLATLPRASVQCVVTSPPYWGLRDYGTATWVGGEPECDHRIPTMRAGRNENRPTLSGSVATNGPQLIRAAQSACGKCGAVRVDAQIGLEPTPSAYVRTMVRVFRAVRRVLRDDGTLWLNLGDSYAAQRGGDAGEGGYGPRGAHRARAQDAKQHHRGAREFGLKHKDLVGIPWRVAFALQRAGWYLRSDIIWSKPNPMPESVKDRPTKSHEYLFLFAKRARYYYDADAIAEDRVTTNGPAVAGWATGPGSHSAIDHARDRGEGETKFAPAEAPGDPPATTRNRRSVWTIAPRPFPEAHFATFPEALPELCILAGSRRGDLVLDPFCGAGTTGLVADRLGRDFVGVELNPEYAEIARRRITSDAPLFADVAVTPRGDK